MTTGERIRIMREYKGLTQTNLADAIGTTKQNIYKYEKGIITNIPPDKLDAIAERLNVQVAYLMGSKKEPDDMDNVIKRIIKEKGISLSQLSVNANMPLEFIEEWYNEGTYITWGQTEKIVRGLGSSMEEVIMQIPAVASLGSDNNDYNPNFINHFDNIKPIQLKRFPMLGEIACGEPIFADEDREHYIMADMDIKADFCLTAKGDSMINARIYDGDVVFIRQTDMVENGEIAAVIIDDEATLKRVYYDREANFLQLVAENPKYKPLVYRDEQLDEVHILGKAVYFMSAL